MTKLGLTDAELKTMATTTPEKLKLEEMIFAATLLENMDAKLKVYKAAQAKFPNDHRAFNTWQVVFCNARQNGRS